MNADLRQQAELLVLGLSKETTIPTISYNIKALRVGLRSGSRMERHLPSCITAQLCMSSEDGVTLMPSWHKLTAQLMAQLSHA